MSNEDGSLWISYNGEVYNYRELSNRLRPHHRFSTRSDTEAIVHLYEDLGPEAFTELNGIFAFALWDQKRRKLTLVRDRFGTKPLYYTQTADGTVLFASEVKALLATGLVKASCDLEGLAEHLTFHNTFGDKTLFAGIKMLEPGTYMTCTEGRIEHHQYWDLDYAQSEEESHPESYYVDALRDLFSQAVKRQLMSEVPVGGYLSGGLDSGSIVAVAAREQRPFHTFTCGFDTSGVAEPERNFDERVEAELLAKTLDTQHHERHIYNGEMTRVLPKVVWHLEDFRVGISYQNYAINELISKYVTVVLSGVGGDELFAGYPWRYQPIMDKKIGPEFDRAYYDTWVRILDDDQKRKLFSGEVNQALSGYSSFDRFNEVLEGDRSDHPLHRALYFDAKTFLHGLFVVEDKLSMAHSVESRVPFMDNELVEFVLKMPASMKLNASSVKHVLRESMRGLLPPEALSRKKQGFTPPDQSWYRKETADYINDLILGDRARDRGYFQPGYVEKLFADHTSGRGNHRFLLWSLMCFEWWNRTFVDGDPVPETAPLPEPADSLAYAV